MSARAAAPRPRASFGISRRRQPAGPLRCGCRPSRPASNSRARSSRCAPAAPWLDLCGARRRVWLINANIPEYLQAHRYNHLPKRPRKLLLHQRQINRLAGAVEREGMTIVPLRLYFNERGRAKIAIALGKGKKLHDKRETEKKRSWERERGRLMREKG
jgi:SsrA-binding protein